MFKILAKKRLAENITSLEIEAPRIVKNAKPGQFVVLRVDEKGERIPLTLYYWDYKRKTISLVFLEVGASTKKLGRLNEGDSILDLVGPLGKPFPLKKYGRVACVGGGVGIPAIYPIARTLREGGNTVDCIIGARHKDLLILDDEIGLVSDTKTVCTDDGSLEVKGFVTDALKERLQDLDLVVAVGPVRMMEAVANLTRGKVPCIVSLNPIMVDGTGMCGACRVVVDGKVKFACVDGPDFDAHTVDFSELMMKNNQYVNEEKHAIKCWEKN
ncbi:MAG: sulfide/dihydroorotate dehydrogenase-like FAD/NAD-binding protein [Candidatus Altiarchaeota archaeon]